MADRARRARGWDTKARVGWIAGRAGVLWVCHIVITVGALLALSGEPRPEWYGNPDLSIKGLVSPTWFAQTVVFMDVLVMYVIFLLATVVILWSDRPPWIVVSGLSITLYAGSQIWPEATLMTSETGFALWVFGAAIGFGIGLYVWCTWLLEQPRDVLRLILDPLELIGRRSLRVYMASCVGVVVAWLVLGDQPGFVRTEVLVVIGVIGCWLVALPAAIGRGRPWSV